MKGHSSSFDLFEGESAVSRLLPEFVNELDQVYKVRIEEHDSLSTRIDKILVDKIKPVPPIQLCQGNNRQQRRRTGMQLVVGRFGQRMDRFMPPVSRPYTLLSTLYA